MDIHQVESFLQAAECGSFSEAARRMRLSQPALSRQIKLLEAELRATLFIRGSTGLKLTEAGQMLLPWARRLLEDSNTLKDMMASLETSCIGELRIACSSNSGRYVLPLLVARFRARYPGVQIKVLSCRPLRAVENLLENEAHLGVVSTEIRQGKLEQQEFFSDEISLIVPRGHAWAGRASIQAEELIGQPFILREETSGSRQASLQALLQFDVSLEDLNVFVEVGNVEAVLQIVAGGYGISFVSDLASQCMRELGYVVKVPIEGLRIRRVNYMARKRIAPPHRPRDAFWGFIHDPENADVLQCRRAGQNAPNAAG